MSGQALADELFADIAHGDEKHREWLKAKLDAWAPRFDAAAQLDAAWAATRVANLRGHVALSEVIDSLSAPECPLCRCRGSHGCMGMREGSKTWCAQIKHELAAICTAAENVLDCAKRHPERLECCHAMDALLRAALDGTTRCSCGLVTMSVGELDAHVKQVPGHRPAKP